MSHRTPRTGAVCALVLVAATLWVCQAHAVTDSTWTNPESGNWSDPANWTLGVPNGAGDVARFTTDILSYRTVTIDNGIPGDGVTLGSLYLWDDNRNYRIEGKGLFLDNVGDPALVEANGGDFRVPVVLNDPAVFNVTDNDLTLRQSVSGGTPGTGITKTGPGRLNLLADSTYTGPTIISEGLLSIGAAHTLGTADAGTVVADGAELWISNSCTVIGEALSLTGAGPDGTGAFGATSTVTWDGPVTLAGDTSVYHGNRYYRLTLAGPVDGPGALAKTGPGVVAVSGTGTYAGDTVIADGRLLAQDGVGLPATTRLVLDGGCFGMLGTGTFTRSVGPGAGKVRWAGSGGFYATGGTMTVNLGGGAAPDTLVCGAPDSIPDGSRLLLGAFDAADALDFRNPIDLTGGSRTIETLGSGAVTLSGPISNGSLTTMGGTLVLAAANTYTGSTTILGGTLRLGADEVLPDAATVVIDSGTLDVGGGHNTLGTVDLKNGTITGGGTLAATELILRKGEVHANMSGPGNVTKTTTGLVQLYGASTYTGTTTVSQGNLYIRHADSLGSPAGGTVVEDGAVLALRQDTVVANEPLALCGAGSISDTGALQGSRAGWGGPITLTGAAVISAGDTFTLSGPIGDEGRGFAITKIGDGILVLGGHNTYTGTTRIEWGTVQLGTDDAFADTVDIILANTSTGNYDRATLDIREFHDTVRNVTLVEGYINGTTGVLTASNFDVRKGSITANLAGPGGVTKTTTETVTLGGTNTYDGPTTVAEGVLKIESGGALGSLRGGTTVAAGAGLVLSAPDSDDEIIILGEPLTIRGSGQDGGGVLIDVTGAHTWTGPIMLADDAVISAGDLTINGPVLGPGGLTKRGYGTLTLASPGQYTGPTNVEQGYLKVAADDALGSGPAPVSVVQGARLILEGDVTVSGKALEVVPGAEPGWQVLTGQRGHCTWDGPIHLTADTSIGVWEGGYLTVTGVIDGPHNLFINGYYTVALTAPNTYGGSTEIGTTVRATDGVGLPAHSNLILNSAVFEGDGPTTFTRPLGEGPGQVQWRWASTRPQGGFSAHGGRMTVNIGGRTTPQTLVCGTTAYFLAGDGGVLLFGSRSADDETVFLNPINLGGKVRSIQVRDNPDSGADCAVLAGAVSNGGILKSGAGTLVLTAPNTYSQNTILEGYGGALRATDGVGLPFSSNLQFAGGVFEAEGTTTFARSLGTGPGQVQWRPLWEGLNVGGGFAAHGGKLTVRIGGAPSTLTWKQYPDFEARFRGTLEFGSRTADSETEFQNPINLDGRLHIVAVVDNPHAPGDFATMSGRLSNGTLEKHGDGTLVLTASNTFTSVIVRRGALRATDGVGLPAGCFLGLGGTTVLEGNGPTYFSRPLGNGPGQISLRGGGFSAYGGKMTVNIGGRRVSPQPLVWDSTPSFAEDGEELFFGSATCDSEVEFLNPMDLGGGERTIHVRDNPFSSDDFVTCSGPISNGSLCKAGDGLLVLAAANAYSGPTTVTEGTLRLTGSLASALIDVHHSATFDVQALSPYALEPGNMLVGDGRVLGDLLVRGTVAPGTSTGTLSICDITFAAGSALEIELGGTHWVLDHDRLISSGTISLQHGSTLDVMLVGWFPQEPGDIFDILDFSRLTGTFTTLNLPDLGPGLWWDTDALYTDGTLGVVPEPATLALLAAGGLGVLLRRRRVVKTS